MALLVHSQTPCVIIVIFRSRPSVLSGKWPGTDGKEPRLPSCPSLALRGSSYLGEEVTPAVGIRNRDQGALPVVGLAVFLDGPVPRRWCLAVMGVSLEAQIFPAQWLASGVQLRLMTWMPGVRLQQQAASPPRLPLKFCPCGQCSCCPIQYANPGD